MEKEKLPTVGIYWPDEVRLKMIEKSEFYPEQEKIYQYGYYDGFQEYHKNHTAPLLDRIKELEDHSNLQIKEHRKRTQERMIELEKENERLKQKLSKYE